MGIQKTVLTQSESRVLTLTQNEALGRLGQGQTHFTLSIMHIKVSLFVRQNTIPVTPSLEHAAIGQFYDGWPQNDYHS